VASKSVSWGQAEVSGAEGEPMIVIAWTMILCVAMMVQN
jgi:hypothetical protein